mgnify:CR=1 FL=1
MFKVKNIAVLYGILILVSCTKDFKESTPSQQSSAASSFHNLIVPSDFKFETYKKVSIDISVQENSSECAIKIYDFYPSAGGNLLYTGYTKNKLTADISIPSFARQLYITYIQPGGSSSLTIVDVQGQSLSHDFGPKKTGLGKTNVVSSPNCATGCDALYNNHNGNITIDGNDPENTICITGSFNGKIKINKSNVVVRVCGDATSKEIELNNGSKLILADGASLEVENFKLNYNGELTVYNAELTIEKHNFSISGKVTNHGTMSVLKSFMINGSSEFTNNGTLNVDENIEVNSTFTNNNSIDVGNDLKINGGAVFTNNCSIIVNDDLEANNPLSNYGFIDVSDKLTINGGGSSTLYNGAMINTKKAYIYAALTGSGTTSLIKVTQTTSIGGGGSLNGNLEYCDANGIETNYGSINAPASLACDVYIPSTSCNSMGNGTPTIIDTDNDGIADEIDVFPNDPNRAGESYYPGSNQFGTLAFEDLWPSRGDYDFNDLIVDFRYRIITNANNEVKDVEIDYSVRAIGGSLRNGFGIELNLPTASVESVTGNELYNNTITNNLNGTEANQTKAVVIAFDDAFDLLTNNGTQTVNTIKTDVFTNPDTLNLRIVLSSPVPSAQLPTSSFNPFIFVGQDRGKEIHLSGKQPTDLMNAAYFQTGDDLTDPSLGDYYVTDSNLPWAIETAENFSYPAEKEDIVQTFGYFGAWAQSGGSISQDWYLDFTGYRNNAKVY